MNTAKYTATYREILIMAALALGIATILVVSSHRRIERVNSDTLIMVSFYRDLFVDHIRIRGWELGPAPFLMPDLPILSLALALTSNIGYGLTLYSLLVYGLLLLSMAVLFKPPSEQWAHDKTFAWATLLTGLLLATLLSAGRNNALAFYLLLPCNHTGALLCGIWIFLLVKRMALRGGNWKAMLGLSLLVIASTFSDLWLIPQFIAPIILSILVFSALRYIRWPLALGLSVNIALSAALGKYLIREMRKYGIFNIPRSRVKESEEYLHAYLRDLSHIVQHQPLLFALIAIFIILTLAFFWSKRKELLRPNERSAETRDEDFNLRFSLFFILIASLASLAAPIALKKWGSMENIRYLLPFFALPPLGLGALLAHSLRAWPAKRLWIAGTMLTAVCLGFSSHNIKYFRRSDLALPYRESFRKMERHLAGRNMLYGYGNYWYARLLTLESRRGLQINEIHPDVYMNQWMNNPNRYFGLPGSNHGEYPAYTFILMNGIESPRVLAQFGEPAQKLRFEENDEALEVWIYNRPQDVKFRNFCRTAAFFRAFRRPESKPVVYSDLAQYIADGTYWEDSDLFPVPADLTLEVKYDQPLSGDVLEISADANDKYHVTLLSEGETIGELDLPPMLGGNMRARFLPLPSEAANRPIDTIQLRPDNDAAPFLLGHLALYKDPSPPEAKATHER